MKITSDMFQRLTIVFIIVFNIHRAAGCRVNRGFAPGCRSVQCQRQRWHRHKWLEEIKSDDSLFAFRGGGGGGITGAFQRISGLSVRHNGCFWRMKRTQIDISDRVEAESGCGEYVADVKDDGVCGELVVNRRKRVSEQARMTTGVVDWGDWGA